jgi:hypothetical protein
MSNSIPKWTEERTTQLVEIVGNGSPVSLEAVADAAAELETTERSVASKLRKMGYDVEKVGAAASRFTEEQEAVLRTFVTDNEGKYTYAEIAEAFEDGEFTAKQIQGKILSMELTSFVRPTPKAETVKTYSDADEEKLISMINKGAALEDLAEAVGRPLNSVRGKALSLLRSGAIEAMPKQRESNAKERTDALETLGDISGLTVVEISEKIGKTPRGVKTMLTRRGLSAKDYDGAGKKAAANE